MLVAAGVVGSFAALLITTLTVLRLRDRDLTQLAKSGGYASSSGPGQVRFRRLLIGAQMVGSCLLLLIAGELVLGVRHMIESSRAGSLERLIVMQPNLPGAGVKGAEAVGYWSSVKAGMARQPGVEGLSLASKTPVWSSATSRYSDAPGLVVNSLAVEPEYFSTVGLRFLAGRAFPGKDATGSVVISRTLAERMYGRSDAVGRPFPPTDPEKTVIGVVEDADWSHNTGAIAEMYTPLEVDKAAVIIVASREPARLFAALRRVSESADRRILAQPRLMRSEVDFHTRNRLAAAAIAIALAGTALLVTLAALVGLIAHTTRLRATEIAIRLALGASRSSITTLIVRETAVACIVGAACGLALGAIASQILTGEPLYLSVPGWKTHAVVLTVTLTCCAIACLIPLTRIARGNEGSALRIA
jgi:hypothetical protein